MHKQTIRAAKAQYRQQKHSGAVPDVVDCGCVIHGTTYDWIYVERLYNMITRHMPRPIRFHVWTEHDRSVPPHMIKHCLDPWAEISGPKRAWWYKMQMFDPRHHAGDLLYFDLDVVIVADLSWAVSESTDRFCTLRDFRYLQRKTHVGINSSMMWWNVQRFDYLWNQFCQIPVQQTIARYPGDQDFLTANIALGDVHYYDSDRVRSWRWECHDGGWNFAKRQHLTPGSGTHIPTGTSVMVFHGHPKPHAIADVTVKTHWQ